jgi:hypothetical protein
MNALRASPLRSGRGATEWAKAGHGLTWRRHREDRVVVVGRVWAVLRPVQSCCSRGDADEHEDCLFHMPSGGQGLRRSRVSVIIQA